MRDKLSCGQAKSTGDPVSNLTQAATIGQAPAAEEDVIVASARWVLPWLVGLAAVVLAAPADAQGNLDAGKSPAKIFADTCAACHRSARELKRSGADFLRAHYTTGPVEASAMAKYLAGIGGEPRANQQRQTPAGDAGQTPATAPNQQRQAKAAQAPAGKKGRAGAEPKSTPTILTDVKPPELPEPPAPPAPPANPPPVLEPFEE
jgi:mono/diheme cytochrome c family protein